MATTNTFKAGGTEIISRLKELIREGNLKRVIIKNSDGKTLLDTTVTIGGAGAAAIFLFSPLIATVTVLVLALKDVSMTIVQEGEEDEKSDSDPNEISG